MIARGRIDEVRTGQPAPLDGAGKISAYRKYPVASPVAVGRLGIDGDTQVNRRYHGGPEKAVYAYPASGYAGWVAEFPELGQRLVPGAMGENLVVSGLDEGSICIGDRIRSGTALLQVSQLREPCSTFAASLGTPRVVRAMARSGRCGWYLRVLEAGVVGHGDAHDVVDRPNPAWSVARFAAVIILKKPVPADLAELAALPGLTPDWVDWAAQRLHRH